MDRFLKKVKEAEEIEYVHRKRLFSDFDEKFPAYFEETHAQFTHVMDCLSGAAKQPLTQQEKELRAFVETHFENIDKASFFALSNVSTTTSVLKSYFSEFSRMPIRRDEYQRKLLSALKATLKARDIIPARPNSLFPDSELDAERLFTSKSSDEISYVENVLMDDGCYTGFVTKQNRRVGEGIFSSKFGDKFVGWWKDDKPHGYGTWIYSDGGRYTGGWECGKQQGCGRYEFASGVGYVGEWKDGSCLGRFNVLSYSYRGWFASSYVAFAVLLYILVSILAKPLLLSGLQFHRHSDGFYFGDLSETQQRSGHGIFIWDSGDFYSGHWLKDEMHGEGTRFIHSGDLYSGTFRRNEFHSGKVLHMLSTGDQLITMMSTEGASREATLLSKSGDLQRGVWNSTHMHGLRLTENNTLFFGTFQEDEPLIGRMIVSYGEESTYIGDFARGERDGFGCLLEGDRVYCGEWARNERSGAGFEVIGKESARVGRFEGRTLVQGKKIAMAGNVFYGEVNKDVESGYGVSIDRNGTTYFGFWEKGLKSGLGTELSSSGSFSTGQFRHNLLYQGKSLRLTKGGELSYYGEIADFGVTGRGVGLKEDGSMYTGQWVAGAMRGTGVEVKANFDFRIGTFAENRLVEGVIYVAKKEGDIYFGGGQHNSNPSRSEQLLYSGQGIYIWNSTSNSSISAYLGDWVSGKMHGSGILLDLGKIVKSGVFNNGRFHSGVLFTGSDFSEIYFGEANNSVKAGKGVSISNNATVRMGYWSGDSQEGPGLQISLNGDYSSGHFQNNVLIHGTALLNLSNGDIYFGERVKGRHNGHGILLSKDKGSGGAINAYVGQWVNGKRHGSGIQMRLGSIIQRGQFSLDKFMAGSIFRVSESAGIYYGAMNNSLRHGKGVFIFTNDTVYSGLWDSDYQDGAGLLISALGDYSSGLFKRNVLAEGLALLNLPKGEIYFGRRVQGKYQGYGVYVWTDKPSSASVYMGEWQSGRMHGSGTLLGLQSAVKKGLFREGRFWTGFVFTSIDSVGVYYGEMDNSGKHGFGTFIYANKTGYSGLWENDQRGGVGTLVHGNGDFCVGEFEKGAFVSGTELRTLENEDVYFGEVASGKFHGNGTYIWRDGPSHFTQAYSGGWYQGHADGTGLLLRLTSNLTTDPLPAPPSTTVLYYENTSIVYGPVQHSLSHGGGVYTWDQGVLSLDPGSMAVLSDGKPSASLGSSLEKLSTEADLIKQAKTQECEASSISLQLAEGRGVVGEELATVVEQAVEVGEVEKRAGLEVRGGVGWSDQEGKLQEEDTAFLSGETGGPPSLITAGTMSIASLLSVLSALLLPLL